MKRFIALVVFLTAFLVLVGTSPPAVYADNTQETHIVLDSHFSTDFQVLNTIQNEVLDVEAGVSHEYLTILGDGLLEDLSSVEVFVASLTKDENSYWIINYNEPNRSRDFTTKKLLLRHDIVFKNVLKIYRC